MVQKSFDSLGLNIKLNVPGTVEEFNALDQTRANACLAEAINNVVYRGCLAEFRDKFITKVLEVTGYKPELDADENWKDSEKLVFKKALAHASKTPESFSTVAQEIADAISFDPTSKERGAGLVKKIAKIYYDAADKVLASGKVEAVAAKLKELLGVEVVVTGVEPAAARENLARAISANEKRKRDLENLKVAEAYTNLAV